MTDPLYALSDSEVTHLEVLEKGPFDPLGWLYRGVYRAMAERGLCYDTGMGFRLTSFGMQCLDRRREQARGKSP